MDININSRHLIKFKEFVYPEISDLKSPNILEFGVSTAAMSTEILLDLCERNNGKLYSVDINDFSSKFNSKNWIFIHRRDEDYNFINTLLPSKLDFIYLDTIHKADHVEKILFKYFHLLKVNCNFVIDDTSWLPYTKNREKNHFFMEVNNYETFFRLIKIYNSNFEKMNLEFSFLGTGAAKITKLSEEELIKPCEINNRFYSFKNLLRLIYNFFILKIKKFNNKKNV